MGLDIYAGTLTRYYTNNWKSITQQWAEENGFKFQRVDAEDKEIPEEDKLSTEEVQKTVENWRDYILQAVRQPDKDPYIPWEDDNEKPYFTHKPDWEAFGAMLLTAASYHYEEPIPLVVEKNWNYTEHPLFQKMAAETGQSWSLFQDVTWWLPISDCFMIQGPLPTGDMVKIGTLGLLRAELEDLNQLAWQEDEEEILSWSRTEGYHTDVEPREDGSIHPEDDKEHTQYDTDSLARYAFSIFWQAMKFAEENNVPILLDF